MIFKWFLRKVKGTDIARPRLLKFGENSEIKLTNVDPKITEAIEDLLNGKSYNPLSKTEENVKVSEGISEVVSNELTHTAVGTFKDKDHVWGVAVIKFDPSSGQAKVDKVVKAGIDKPEAEERFRILAVSEGAL